MLEVVISCTGDQLANFWGQKNRRIFGDKCTTSCWPIEEIWTARYEKLTN